MLAAAGARGIPRRSAWLLDDGERDTHRTMPDESTTPDLDLLQRSIDALNARDIDAAMNLYAPTSSGRGECKVLRVVLPYAASSRTG